MDEKMHDKKINDNSRPEHVLWTSPTSSEEALKKYKIAKRVLEMLVAAGFVTRHKVEQAIDIVADLRD